MIYPSGNRTLIPGGNSIWVMLRALKPPHSTTRNGARSTSRMTGVLKIYLQLKAKKQIGPFSEDSQGKGSTGNVLGGTGWYRKAFTLDQSSEGKKVQILFDGVYMNSEVFINGHSLGVHPYGYTPFYFDLTPHLKPAGEQNVLAVKVNNNGKNSRWYSGSGIYRHVNLIVTGKVNIPVLGNFCDYSGSERRKSFCQA